MAINLENVLDSATKVIPEKKSTTKLPILQVDYRVKEKVAKYRELYAEKENLETELKILGEEILEKVSRERERLCTSHYIGSVRVPDNTGLSIAVIWKHAYSKVAYHLAPVIKAIIGEEQYNRFFKVDMEIKLKDTSEATLLSLIGLIGEEKFMEYFIVNRNIIPNTSFTENFFNVFNIDEREKLRGIVVQYKPSIMTK